MTFQRTINPVEKTIMTVE